MRNWRLARKPYWVAVAIFLMLRLGLAIALDFVPATMPVLRHVDTPLVIVLAFIVGARFADAGWPRWLGIALVFLVSVVLPIMLVIAMALALKIQNPFDDLMPVLWLVTAALIALLIVAGIRPSVSVPVVSTAPIEPKL